MDFGINMWCKKDLFVKTVVAFASTNFRKGKISQRDGTFDRYTIKEMVNTSNY